MIGQLSYLGVLIVPRWGILFYDWSVIIPRCTHCT